MSEAWFVGAVVASTMLGVWCVVCCCLSRAVRPLPSHASSFRYHAVHPVSPRHHGVPDNTVASPPRHAESPIVVVAEPAARPPQPGLHFISTNVASINA